MRAQTNPLAGVTAAQPGRYRCRYLADVVVATRTHREQRRQAVRVARGLDLIDQIAARMLIAETFTPAPPESPDGGDTGSPGMRDRIRGEREP